MSRDRTLPETFEERLAEAEREEGLKLLRWERDHCYRCWSLARTLQESVKKREAEELAKRDWPPWPSTIYWPPTGSPQWHEQCAKRRRDWSEEQKRKEGRENG